MKRQIEVVAAVIIKDNKIFCAQRPNKGEVGLKWEFPGGKIELGETKEEALIREIKEELNSEIKVLEYITTVKHEYSTFFLTMHVFKCQLVSGNLEISEHVDAKWVTYDEIKSLDWAPADIEIIDLLLKLK